MHAKSIRVLSLTALATGCVANLEPAEPELTGPGTPPVEVSATMAPEPSTKHPRPPIDPSCDGWGCGANHNRRVMRLAQESS
jgi:hypothetical protein